MDDRVSFSGQHLDLPQIVAHHTDVKSSLRNYFSPASPDYDIRFDAYKASEVKKELDIRLAENDRTVIFTVLAALEAAFRIDYLLRSYKKKKDPLSRSLRDLHREKGSRASLEEDILDQWKKHTSVSKRFIGDLKGAFRYRHWLAHGRYWEPKLGHKYDYEGVCILAQEIFDFFPFEDIKQE